MPDNTYPDQQAFPSDREDGFLGLTKREYFAVIALQGLLAYSHPNSEYLGELTKAAVDYADRLIEALNK